MYAYNVENNYLGCIHKVHHITYISVGSRPQQHPYM
jgi:hypothetical protein